MSVIPNVLQQHAEETAILWLRRDHAVGEPHYTLADIANLDDRLEAHLDGLRIAKEDGWKVCQKELAWEEPGEVFAAAVLAMESGLTERIEPVVEVGSSTPELQRGLVSALGWNLGDYHPDLLTKLIASNEPSRRRVGVSTNAICRKGLGESLSELIRDDDPRVRARALRAAGELGTTAQLQLVSNAVSDDDESCRFWAAWSAAKLSDRSGTVIRMLKEFAQRPGSFQAQAVAMFVRITTPETATRWLGELWKDTNLKRAAAIGIGALGDPKLMDALFQAMQVDDVAQVAGEAFSMITGLDLAYEDLEQDIPEGFQSGPTEDPDDENVALNPDENLPWPNFKLMVDWWNTHNKDFKPGQRYLCGREIDIESLGKTLIDGKQRQRASAALELAILQPGKPLFEVRAPGFRQQQWLAGQ